MKTNKSIANNSVSSQVPIPPNVEVYSYGDFCERIVVKNPNANENDPRIKHKPLPTINVKVSNSDNLFLNAPDDPQGVGYDLSDRPILCSSLFKNELVIGCSDHAVYAIPLFDDPSTKPTSHSRLKSRPLINASKKSYYTLYSKSYGHTDWVTTVTYLTDGRILSGGMDSRICLWSMDKSSCIALDGHDMSVTKILPLYPYNMAVSCGYDKKACLWKFSPPSSSSSSSNSSMYSNSRSIGRISSSSSSSSSIRQGYNSTNTNKTTLNRAQNNQITPKPIEYFLGHSDPILECAILNPTYISHYNTSYDNVNRSGIDMNNDTNNTMNIPSSPNQDIKLITADRNNCIKLWDMNTGHCISTYSKQVTHRGMVTSLFTYYTTYSPMMMSSTHNMNSSSHPVSYNNNQPNLFVSGGADGCVVMWDTRIGTHPIHRISAHTQVNPSVTTSSSSSSNQSGIKPPSLSASSSRLSSVNSIGKIQRTSSARLGLNPTTSVSGTNTTKIRSSPATNTTTNTTTTNTINSNNSAYRKQDSMSSSSLNATNVKSIYSQLEMNSDDLDAIHTGINNVSLNGRLMSTSSTSSSALSNSTPRKSLRPSRLQAKQTSSSSLLHTNDSLSSYSSLAQENHTNITINKTSSATTKSTASSNSTAMNDIVSNSSNQSKTGQPVTSISSLPDDADMNYLLTGGMDGRLLLLDLRYLSSTLSNHQIHETEHQKLGIVAEYGGHQGGVYSMHVVNNQCVYTGDAGGTLYCHQLTASSSSSFSTSMLGAIQCRYGIGASSQGAVKTIHSLYRPSTSVSDTDTTMDIHAYDSERKYDGVIVTTGDDGKALVFKYSS